MPSNDIWDNVVWPEGWQVRHVAETGSTNSDLLDEAASGKLADRTVLAADHQTAGRGRLDRRWDAPVGANLLVSIYLATVPDSPAVAMHRVGLAALHAIDDQVGAAALSSGPGDAMQIGLKWPNDLLLGGRKLAGVLAQRRQGVAGLVVGIGLNVGWAPEGAGRLHDLDALSTVTPPGVLAAMLAAFARLPTDVAELYRSRLLTLGHDVRVELPGGGHTTGRAVDVDDEGRLAVRTADGAVERFDVGDVVHLRPVR